VPVLESNPEGVARGAYIIADSAGTPEVILIATGSEVSLALDAKTALEVQGKKVRVVSAPSWDIFAKQDRAYRDSVLPPNVKARVGIEAGSSLGWERFVGLDGVLVCLDRFGASAPDAIVFEKLGFTVENVIKHALEVM
jgi:transketolase